MEINLVGPNRALRWDHGPTANLLCSTLPYRKLSDDESHIIS